MPVGFSSAEPCRLLLLEVRPATARFRGLTQLSAIARFFMATDHVPFRRPVRMAHWRLLAFVFWTPIATSVLLFAILELFPGLLQHVDLSAIRYYELHTWYRPDPKLVFAGRFGEVKRYEGVLRGDLYDPQYGIEVPPVRFVETYTKQGFRANLSSPPWDVVFIGDSYVWYGERDDLTLSEMVKQDSGLSTYNLSQPWYGPWQYVELLRRYAAEIRPRYAVFCWFDGNDLNDTREYEQWQLRGQYYDFARGGVVARYVRVVNETFDLLAPMFTGLRQAPTVSDRALGSTTHPDLALVRLGDKLETMRFGYLSSTRDATTLLETEDWQRVKRAFESFAAVARANKILPVLLFIPDKWQIYAPYVSDTSGARVIENLSASLRFRSSSAEAISTLSRRVGIPVIDLSSVFAEDAAHGGLLYYAFDTHWNPRGRQIAARAITHWFGAKQRRSINSRLESAESSATTFAP